MKLIAVNEISVATGRQELVGFNEDGDAKSRNISLEHAPGVLFEIDDGEGERLLKLGAARVPSEAEIARGCSSDPVDLIG
jgi:hypothetical protein